MRKYALLAAFLVLPALPTAAQQAAPTVPVGVVTAASVPVTQGMEFVGRVEATGRVEVRARVTGYLEKVEFTEGDIVRAGEKLFLIEQPPFQAAVQQARGALLQAQAQLSNATIQRQRAEELVKTSATSVAVRDERVAAEKTAGGGVMAAQADLQTAEINLGYTSITAPITGKIGRASVTVGNVVSPQSGPLARIVSQDPMYVTFPVSQREFLRLRTEGVEEARSAAVVRIRFSDGSVYPEPGRLNFVDVTVDRSTDTILVRATVPNPKGELVDGQFVRVRVEGPTPKEQIVVPQSAIVLDQQGAYVFIVEDGKAVVRRLRTGQQVGRNIVVEEGLRGGEQVVVDGITTLRPGAAVVAGPAKEV
ncbi:Efflux pump periplasmic linker BepF [Rhodovastum atsumiense]|uniref:Efflux RND transporter periplasmic adaptor subunit n=1 Tax=Rhodovastum atsumiense TaxID=504468 RepID=A0A5M6IML7_9PROT|nr:efflux RND transporter periplasmic adaptor subunit [Rhodovastum atsumiense]KAA5609197.1 efflux RND transporter periplasmic adaptor subunit [Rhodovastum atsumiense]CAH2603978.1 Efflux pump periplasmic linker BepF [Rhodovastum atsumiense]